MSKIRKVSDSIEKLRENGSNPTKILMSRSFAIALKEEMVPNIKEYFVSGKMTVLGVPWEIDKSIRGFKVEVVSE